MQRLYKHNGFLVPQWRRRGIGQALLIWTENRLRSIAETHPPETEKFFQANASQFQTGIAAMLEQAEYQPIRHFYEMVRPTLDDILEFHLPSELEIRPVTGRKSARIFRCWWMGRCRI